jgi:hypothetical protein
MAILNAAPSTQGLFTNKFKSIKTKLLEEKRKIYFNENLFRKKLDPKYIRRD